MQHALLALHADQVWMPVTGMEKAQSLMPHPIMHMPSKTTVLLCVVVLHVVALSYLMYALYTAQRQAALPPLEILHPTVAHGMHLCSHAQPCQCCAKSQ